MERKIYGFVFLAMLLSLPGPKCAAQTTASDVLKQQERYSLSLDLEFSRKKGNPLERSVSVIFGADLNAYATGFLVGDGLVMTAYHVVSGELSDVKKLNMGFKSNDQLNVRVFIKGCRATVIKIDKEADLALLEVCRSQKQIKAPAFQTAPGKDEKLVLIARPHGDRMVSHGIFYGSYTLRGQEYLSAKIEGHDGYSGSPVYNHKGELVGIFTGYDWAQDVALISPGSKAQKLLEDYMANPKP
ncbi:MAG: serine protease [Pyrinomonadaceae bacterium]